MAVGTFDGVHRGHRRVIEAAQDTRLRTGVVTFDPHPRAVLGDGVELLATLERRLELLEDTGIEDVLVLPFDQQLAALPAAEFAEQMLRGIGAEIVAAGETFRFGRGREGDLDLLEQLGFEVRRVPLVDGASSSRVRKLVHSGQSRPLPRYSGDRLRSRGSWFAATDAAATRVPDREPRRSRRASRSARRRVCRRAHRHRAAVSIGTNPHFDGVERRVEAYLLDFDGDLYGERLLVEFWGLLRGQRRFDSLEELVATIADDVEHVRAAVRPG